MIDYMSTTVVEDIKVELVVKFRARPLYIQKNTKNMREREYINTQRHIHAINGEIY